MLCNPISIQICVLPAGQISQHFIVAVKISVWLKHHNFYYFSIFQPLMLDYIALADAIAFYTFCDLSPIETYVLFFYASQSHWENITIHLRWMDGKMKGLPSELGDCIIVGKGMKCRKTLVNLLIFLVLYGRTLDFWFTEK